MADRISYVGLDVHKEGIVVAVAEGGLRGEVREYGRIANTAAALKRLVRKLGGDGITLRFCYEAGPCGYGIQRQLSASKHECVIVAPSLIPKRPGDRVKTDRRDAAGLAKLHRAGELTAVWVPDAGHEAMRDLVRARLDAVHALRRARQQLAGFCCASVAIMDVRPGPSCIAGGWPVCASRRRRTTLCSRITFRRSKPPRPSAIG
jgi:transposase